MSETLLYPVHNNKNNYYYYSLLNMALCSHFTGTGTDQGDELERKTVADTPGTGDPGHIGLHATTQQPHGQPEQPVV